MWLGSQIRSHYFDPVKYREPGHEVCVGMSDEGMRKANGSAGKMQAVLMVGISVLFKAVP
ncbi:hypothetical protein ES702_03658 [subsurface metagenome]